MAEYQIAFHLPSKQAVIQPVGTALPAAIGGVTFKNIGTFTHDDVEPALKDLEFDVNHVVWHHVREALYHTNSKTGVAVPGTLQFPDNITDMEGVTLSWDITAISLGPDFQITVGQTVQSHVAVQPIGAALGSLTFVSSDPTKATVDSHGIVTGVAAGTTNLTVTAGNGKTDTAVVTVVAA